MSLAKGSFYWSQLQTSLTAGQWESSVPGKNPKGSPLSWSDLLRKFRKHCPEHDEVREAASQTHLVSLLLARGGATATDLDAHGEGPWGTLRLGDECVLLEEKKDEAQTGYEALQALGSSNDSVKLASAYLAFALDLPEQCLYHLSNTPSFSETLHSDLPLAELDSEQASRVTESLRAFCLQGMSLEKLSSTASALASYTKGVVLISSFTIPPSLPNKAGRPNANPTPFVRFRELWRWSERLMWRAIILHARLQSVDSHTSIFPLFRLYTRHSVHWPPTFRPWHRSAVLTLHLRALVFLASDPECKNKTFSGSGKHHWLAETRSVLNEFRAILDMNTKFPRSGERNVAVEEFIDLCVAVWEASGASGEHGGWVLDILWWGTRLTFNSQRILRHMTRLMHVSGDNLLAKRTLKLYIQIVTKAREAAAEGANEDDVVDSNKQFVETAIDGARMLCRLPGGVEEAREAGVLIEKARQRLERDDEELAANVDLAEGIQKSILALREQEPSTRASHLSSSVQHLTRSLERHTTPSAYYHAAIAVSRPGVECDLTLSIEYARKAVEAEPRELRFWHLLALLEGKAGEWKKAKGLLEAAAGIVEEVEEELREEERQANGIQVRDFGGSDFGSTSRRQSVTTEPHAINGNASINGFEDPHAVHTLPPLISSTDDTIPRAALLLKPLPDHPRPSRRELFEHALQLRMTELALTELLMGPDGVEVQWPSVFAWFADRGDISVMQGRSSRTSLDGGSYTIPETPVTEDPNAEKALGDLEERQRSNPTDAEKLNSHSVLAIPPTITVQTDMGITTALSNGNGEQAQSLAVSPTSGTERRTSLSPERERDTSSKGRKVQRMLKDGVHKGQARINTVSKKIGNGVKKGAVGTLHRTHSLPDFNAVLLRSHPYQASSIHSRKRVISWGARSHRGDRNSPSPVPSVLPPPPPPMPVFPGVKTDGRSARERRLLSDLWLMSAATFRRVGKIEQTRAAIQEAELLDEENEAVWVQLGLYFSALGDDSKAIQSFHKALFISPDDCSAIVHLSRLYLAMAQDEADSASSSSSDPDEEDEFRKNTSRGNIDIAAGLLENLTRRNGWDVTEAWYLLAKAYGLQGRKERERECLVYALGLAETRGVRDIGVALGWCL